MRGRWWFAAVRPQGKKAGVWALPKGLVDAGEGPAETALREGLEETGVTAATRVRDLTDAEVARLRQVIERSVKVEGALRTEVAMNIKRLMDIGSYRGIRHRKGLPLRGQRTHTNARTRKGPRRGVGIRKKSASKNPTTGKA